MAKKFKEAQARLFTNIYVCRKCKHKIRSTSMRVLEGKTKCRHCGRRYLRPKKKERKIL
ncbi:50S ribosomal protein L40e [archaeon]|nr:50S ribosomal protein L40e [archaeon]